MTCDYTVTNHEAVDDDDQDRVFKALADRTRRALLDRLRSRNGQSLAELTEGFEMSRFGVAKHLRIPDGQSLWGRGTIAEWDPPHRLVHTWRSLYDPRAHDEPASRVTWEITEQGGGYCLLRVTHDHLEHSPITADGVAGEGWMLVLSGLKSVVETGQGLIATKEA